MTENLSNIKASLIEELEQRQNDKILEESNVKLLKNLINNADSDVEAIAIAQLGTTYKKTGFHFDKRLEITTGEEIQYKTRNEKLTFSNDKTRLTHELIIGDNYPALLNLLVTHKGLIDVIYIDPPYGKDNMGDFAKTNYKNAISRDNLLSMLYPRLLLAKQLLSNDGFIFVSIDDKNLAYVKCLMDDIFGEQNSIQVYTWESNFKPDNSSPLIRPNAEYVICFSGKRDKTTYFKKFSSETKGMPSLTKASEKLKTIKFPANSVHTCLPDGHYNKDNYPNNDWKLLADIDVKDGIITTELVLEGHSYWATERKILEELSNGTEIWIKSEKFIPYYLKKDSGMVVPTTILPNNIITDYADSKKELESIVGKSKFDNPKPTSLIKFLVSCVDNPCATVLDFFAGSGTTGHAVMALNREDGGNRRFILCSNNEVTDKNPNGIAYDVTTKRLKRVMSGECYDKDKAFKWIESNEPYLDNLEVYEIGLVNNSEAQNGKTPFDVIDETCYGLEKFNNIQEKIQWICENFENTQKYLQTTKGEE